MLRGLPVRVFLATLFLALAASRASAASREADYIAARDRALAQIENFDGNRAARVTLDARLMRDLGKRLAGIIGDPQIQGFPTVGGLNAETLIDEDAGGIGLDGLLYVSSRDKAQVVVSTVGLTERMMRADTRLDMQERRWMPPTLGAALLSEEFYFTALGKDSVSSDKLFVLFGELPLARLAKVDTQVGLLVAHTGDPEPAGPNEVIVAVVQGGKVKIAIAPLIEPAPAVAACETIHAEAESEGKAMNVAEQAAKNDGERTKLLDKSEADQAAALRAHAQCVADAAPHQAYYAAAVDQARALSERLVAK